MVKPLTEAHWKLMKQIMPKKISYILECPNFPQEICGCHANVSLD